MSQQQQPQGHRQSSSQQQQFSSQQGLQSEQQQQQQQPVGAGGESVSQKLQQQHQHKEMQEQERFGQQEQLGSKQQERSGQFSQQQERSGQFSQQQERPGQFSQEQERYGQQQERSGQFSQQERSGQLGLGQQERSGQFSQQERSSQLGLGQQERSGQFSQQQERSGQFGQQQERSGQLGLGQQERSGQFSQQQERYGQQQERFGQQGQQQERYGQQQERFGQQGQQQERFGQQGQQQEQLGKQQIPQSYTGQKEVMWGFLSTAKITNKMKKAVDDSSNGRVAAIASRTLGQADDWVKYHMEQGEEITSYGTYEAMFNDKNVNIVYLPLPSGLKKEWAMKAAHNKKHVLCEKPFTCAAEVADIINVCKQNNVCFWDNSMFVHHPRTKEIMNLIKSGELGEIRHINAAFSFVMTDDSNIRYHQETEPKGALGDIGWYAVKATLLALNMELPKKVFATASYKNNVIQSCCAILYFQDPLKGATIHCGFTSSTHQNFTVSGTQKTLTVDDFFFPFHDDPYEYPKCEQTHMTYYQLRDQEGRLETRQVYSPKRQEVLLVEKFGELMLRKQKGNLRKDLEEKYHAFALNTTKVLDAIEESAKKGVPVDLK